MLDLTFLATGYRRRVFVRTGQSERRVCQPLAIFWALPYEHRIRAVDRVTS
jgi:hypothetical protein